MFSAGMVRSNITLDQSVWVDLIRLSDKVNSTEKANTSEQTVGSAMGIAKADILCLWFSYCAANG